MKTFFLFIFIISSLECFSQSFSEKGIIQLSNKIFNWEVENKIDSLNKVFHEKFMVIGSDGNGQIKKEYLSRLQSGTFVHDTIQVEENSAVVAGNTSVIYGKGKFMVTVSGKKHTLHLSYMEVFVRTDSKKPWQVLFMKASTL